MTPPARGPQRREDDFDRDVSRWAAMMLLHRGKIMTALSALGLVIGWVIATAGYRYVGPPHDIQELRADMAKRDTALTLRAVRLEEAKQQQLSRIEALESSSHFQVYLSCVLFRRIDPGGTPLECGPIIQGGPKQ
jgi:hypothetical protein